jgi:hypothetical protein
MLLLRCVQYTKADSYSPNMTPQLIIFGAWLRPVLCSQCVLRETALRVTRDRSDASLLLLVQMHCAVLELPSQHKQLLATQDRTS